MNPLHTPVNLLTGGTGFLGSHIGAELLRRGQETFFLIRKRGKTTAEERLKRILDWHGIDATQRTKAHTVESRPEDFVPISGLPKQPIIDRIIHCASDTSFSERRRTRVWTANVDNLKGLLDLVLQAHIPTFIHVSTAYAAGRCTGYCPEVPIQNRHFFNVYEASKACAEKMLLERCRHAGIALTILRPSIVYGHSQTGKTFRFNALYYPIKTLLFLRRIFTADIRKKGGLQAAAMGISSNADGTMQFPLRIDVGENGGVNLIPVDFFVAAFCAVTAEALEGGIFHIVNTRQTRIADIIAFARDQFGLRGLRACPSAAFQKKARNSLEQLFERYLAAYSPYMRDQRRFSTQRTDPILKRHGLRCPPFDAGMHRRCMAYAVKHDWAGLSI